MTKRSQPIIKLPRMPRGTGISQREFERGLKVLQRHGLIKKDTKVKNIDPTRWFRRVFERNYGLIAGTQTTVKVSPELALKRLEAGHKVIRTKKGYRSVEQYKPETRLREVKGELKRYQIAKKGGGKKVKVSSRIANVKFVTAEQYVRDLYSYAFELNTKLQPGEFIGAELTFGEHPSVTHNTIHAFPNWNALLDYISHYENLSDIADIHFIKVEGDNMAPNPKTEKPRRIVSYEERQRAIRKAGPMAIAIQRAKWRRQKRALRGKMSESERKAKQNAEKRRQRAKG